MKPTKEELIKIALQNIEEFKKPVSPKKEVQAFVSDMDIKEGKHRIKPKIIYQAYLLWSSQKKKKYREFSKEFAELFIKENANGQNFYLLNYKPIALLNAVDNKRIKIK